MSSAPPSSPSGAPSSAGWNRNLTVPCSSSRIPARAAATPMRMATWVSCPQACMTGTVSPLYSPVASDRKGRSFRSGTGNASMSARRAITGPGRPPSRMPTTPVCATPVVTSIPSDSRCWATIAAGLELAIGKLGVLMDLTPPLDDLLLEVGSHLLHLGPALGGTVHGGREGGEKRKEEKGNGSKRHRNTPQKMLGPELGDEYGRMSGRTQCGTYRSRPRRSASGQTDGRDFRTLKRPRPRITSLFAQF